MNILEIHLFEPKTWGVTYSGAIALQSPSVRKGHSRKSVKPESRRRFACDEALSLFHFSSPGSRLFFFFAVHFAISLGNIRELCQLTWHSVRVFRGHQSGAVLAVPGHHDEGSHLPTVCYSTHVSHHQVCFACFVHAAERKTLSGHYLWSKQSLGCGAFELT